jgi:predicted HicB family RNase H-like nuclease
MFEDIRIVTLGRSLLCSERLSKKRFPSHVRKCDNIMVRKPTDTIQLKVRMSETLRRQMEDAAVRNGRSMNAEIVARLGNSIQKSAWHRLRVWKFIK